MNEPVLQILKKVWNSNVEWTQILTISAIFSCEKKVRTRVFRRLFGRGWEANCAALVLCLLAIAFRYLPLSPWRPSTPSLPGAPGIPLIPSKPTPGKPSRPSSPTKERLILIYLPVDTNPIKSFNPLLVSQGEISFFSGSLGDEFIIVRIVMSDRKTN